MEFKIKFKPEISSLKDFKVHVEKELKSWDIPFMEMMDSLLAIDESITNIITHAYKDNKPDDLIEFSMRGDKHLLIIEIIDNGMPFDINSAPLPDIKKNLSGKKQGGFGVHLIKSVMNETSYARINGKNILTLKKFIDV